MVTAAMSRRTCWDARPRAKEADVKILTRTSVEHSRGQRETINSHEALD